MTDYPDEALVENLRFNIATCRDLLERSHIHAEVRGTDHFLVSVAKGN